MTLIRQALSNLNTMEQLTAQSVIDDMVGYFNRQTDHEAIRTAIKARYGVGIKPVDDAIADESTLETYTKNGFSEQVDAGIIEAISSGFGHKIVSALATLFTEEGQKYGLVHESVEDLEDAEALLNAHRDAGGYNAVLSEADRLSIECGSAAVFLQWRHGHVSYQKLSPADVTMFFGAIIEEDGEERLVDISDVEDASAVVIRLSQVDSATWNYLAIMGRTEVNPNGRWVTFQSTSVVSSIPDVGEEGTIEFEMEGGPANPLSYYANQYPDKDIPEYPIAIILSGLTESGEVMPVSTSLYNDSVEFDMAASRLLSTSQDAARGTTVISRNAQGRNHPLPRSVTGVVALDDGQTIEHISMDPDASTSGMQVLKDLMTEMASGYSVPDYMVASEDHMLEASSGIALQVKTRPLKKFREHRIEINIPAVRKVFEIEKAMIDLFDDELSGSSSVLVECEQDWDAGELKLPENKKESSERIIALLDKGIIDTIEAIREYYRLTSDEEAIEFYEKMSARKTEFPPLQNGPEQKKPLGLQRTNATSLR